jgi:peptidoglycan/LPS O-acetylase OafA/YrhL
VKVSNKVNEIKWLDALRGFALLSILLNHLVEEFGSGPWFTNPSNNWPDFYTRIRNIFPGDFSSPVLSFVQFLGWLGDSGPGVFILVSGIGLTWAALHRPRGEINVTEFYKRRLARIFPLYIAMHLVILGGSLFIPSSSLNLAHPKTLLSLLGLRFTDSLFFYISPAWWFIWLIIQLYIIFPFLYLLMDRVGIKWFLVITLTLTFVSRLIGILYSKSLYFWMTGIFFGTRLAEFTMGMAIAVLLFQAERQRQQIHGVNRILALSFPIYLLGLFCSLTLPGSIVSNLLVTLGMAGLFYSFWEGLIKKYYFFATPLMWVGIHSYSVYLLHQTPLKWTAELYSGVWHLTAAILVLLISFPAGRMIDYLVEQVQQVTKKTMAIESIRWISLIVMAGVVFSLYFIEPRLGSVVKYRAFSLLLGISLIFLIYVECISLREHWVERFFRWTLLLSGGLQLFLFPPQYGKISFPVGILIALVSIILVRFLYSRALAWGLGLFFIFSICLALEVGLRHYRPLEAGRWGEFPALQIHPTRTYSLKANQETHLRYNNYDYIVKTNSFGLASPEIGIGRPTPDTLRVLVIGDAFSMPEGMEYPNAYPALLEKPLSERVPGRNIQVINAGVTGYGPAEQLPQLRELGPILKPDVVLYQFFINEFEEVRVKPEERLKNIGLLKRSGSFRNHFFESSQLITHYRLFYENVKEMITRKPAVWKYWKSLLYFYRVGGNDFYGEKNLMKVGSYLDEMNQICKKIGAKFVIYFVPGAIAVSKVSDISYFPRDQNLTDSSKYDLERPLRHLLEITSGLDIPVVDLTPYLREHTHQPVYFSESWHWNKEGHKVVARAISESLFKLGYISPK